MVSPANIGLTRAASFRTQTMRVSCAGNTVSATLTLALPHAALERARTLSVLVAAQQSCVNTCLSARPLGARPLVSCFTTEHRRMWQGLRALRMSNAGTPSSPISLQSSTVSFD